MQELYRSQYPGEFVIIKTTFKNGRKEQIREWIENPIQNTSQSLRACCVSNLQLGTPIPLTRIEHHRGDLLGRNKMQLYTCEELWQEIKSDFVVVFDRSQLDEILAAHYQVDNVVYTSARLCIDYPGEFYLIPHGISFVSAATAVWLACFDGHRDIYLVGYDYLEGHEKTVESVKIIMQTYNNINFYHVTDAGTPDKWKRCINCETISSRKFISECDI